jgi:hypothetical protein
MKGAAGAVAGAAAGAVITAITGPAGAAIGALIGGTLGAAAGVALRDEEQEQPRRAEELERETGVIDDDLDAASPSQPTPQQGPFHADAIGVRRPGTEPSEGILQNADGAENEETYPHASARRAGRWRHLGSRRRSELFRALGFRPH